ncbi:hypothetical protein P691DRAFT_792104 [Macrolepiota fuliginosa MF-IS2]|uniref:ATP-dependent DNA helicase n=1 Tax=Macrolepiota fuliginosa MF-IS2 TaxID=1400762 RepID=A0A9P6C7N5_9AGAR|nr:hypothetical protein P691DRAFT_792104 [Macrolepiota fuliginosa MF-IS2]
MPKAKGMKYYAVAVGRDAPGVYSTWAENSDSSLVPLNVGEPPKPVQDQLESKVTLSPEQSRVFTRVKEGWNVFFTGSAEIIKLRHNPTRVAITASTGIAAINIGGATLHSWAGIKLGTEPVKSFVGKVRNQPSFEPLLRRWQGVQTLIIDENLCSFDDRWHPI